MKKILLSTLTLILISVNAFSAQIFYNVETDTKRVILTAGQTNDTELYTQHNFITVTGPVNLDELDVFVDANTLQISEFVTLSGVVAHSTDYGLFDGVTIPDNSDGKEALQALETAVETKADQTDLDTTNTAVGLNTAKDTNVSTSLSVGTVGVSTVAITSDGGADDVTLPASTNAVAGMATAAQITAIEANTAKVTEQDTGTNTGDQVGDGVTITGAGTVGDPFVSTASGSMVYPGAGIPLSTGSAWDTSFTQATLAAAQDLEDHDFSGVVDLTNTTSLAMGPNKYTPSVDPPDEEGLYHYQSGIAGFDASMLTHYSNGAVQYPVESPELPTVTGEYYAYNSVTNIMEVVSADSLSITEQAGDPAFSGMSTGDLIVATGSGDMFYKSATGGYTIPGTYTIDAIIPGFTSATVNGVDLQVIFSTPVSQGAGWLETLFTVDGTVTGAGINMTFVDIDGTDTWNFTLDTPMVEDDVVTLDYPTTANGVESSTGDDLAALIAESVTNNTSDLVVTTANDVAPTSTAAMAETQAKGQSFECVAGTLGAIGIHVDSTTAGAELEIRWGPAADLTTVYETATIIVASDGDAQWHQGFFTPAATSASTTYYFGVLLISGDCSLSTSGDTYPDGDYNFASAGDYWLMSGTLAADTLFRIYQ